jgi:hypothetical protein
MFQALRLVAGRIRRPALASGAPLSIILVGEFRDWLPRMGKKHANSPHWMCRWFNWHAVEIVCESEKPL